MDSFTGLYYNPDFNRMVVMILVPYYYYNYCVIVLSVLFLIIKSGLFAVISLSLCTAFFITLLHLLAHILICLCVCVCACVCVYTFYLSFRCLGICILNSANVH